MKRKRLYEKKIIALVFAVLLALALTVTSALPSVREVLGAGFIPFIIISSFLLIISTLLLIGAIYRRVIYCAACGERLRRETVSFSLGKIDADEMRAVQDVRFVATCHRCGKKRIVDKRFTFIRVRLDGSWKSFEVDEAAIEFIEKTFNRP